MAIQDPLRDVGVRGVGLRELGQRPLAGGAEPVGVDGADEVEDRGVGLAVELVQDPELEVRDRHQRIARQRLVERRPSLGVLLGGAEDLGALHPGD